MWIANSQLQKARLIALNAVDPAWSSNSDRIAFALNPTGDDYDIAAEMIDANSGRLLFRSRSGINPSNPVLSPTGKFIGVDFHLSRPVTGDVIFNTLTGAAVSKSKDIGEPDQFTPPQYLPGLIEDWSPNGKWILWDWRVPDAANDGSWLKDEVGLTSLNASARRRIGSGKNARFSQDGKYIFFLQPEAGSTSIYDLVLTTRQIGKVQCLARNVDSFFTYQ
jgi:Tol biopolymer transport system component